MAGELGTSGHWEKEGFVYFHWPYYAAMGVEKHKVHLGKYSRLLLGAMTVSAPVLPRHSIVVAGIAYSRALG